MTVFTAQDAQALLDSRDLIEIGSRGDEVRRARHGIQTTFVRVLEIHAGAVPAALPSGAEPGEIRLCGRPQSGEDAAAAVARARPLADRAGVPLTAYVLTDLYELAGRSTDGVRSLLTSLTSAGLATIAEAPVDVVPEIADIVSLARDVGLGVPRLTVQGSADTPAAAETRVSHVERAEQIQRAAGGVRSFAPLPRVSSVAQPSTGYDDIKVIAMTRLLSANIDSIQVDWSLYGPKLAQVALTAGADDVDAVSALAGNLGRRRSPLEEIRGNIIAAGLQALERQAWE
jgi:aminodeoxyfutalosine synthase